MGSIKNTAVFYSDGCALSSHLQGRLPSVLAAVVFSCPDSRKKEFVKNFAISLDKKRNLHIIIYEQ